MSDRLLKITSALLAAAILAYGAHLAWARLHPAPLPAFFEVPAFSLTDQDGRKWDSAGLKGKVWVASFIYSTCKGSCPMLGAQLKRLQASLPRGEGFHLVSISVDPEKDTPGRMRRYALDLGADLSRWTFLTGRKADIKRIAVQGFKLASEPGEAVGPERDILHSNKLVLLDKASVIRGYYDGLLSAAAEEIHRDALRLAGEP